MPIAPGALVVRTISMVVLALALLPGAALAQKANRPAVKVGDEWHFVVYASVPSTTPNRQWVVKSLGPAGSKPPRTASRWC